MPLRTNWHMALRELAINADKQDDLLLDEFKMLQAVEADHLQEVPLCWKKKPNTNSFRRITNTIQEINHGPLNREQYPGAIAYLLLHLVFKLDYLTKPEGYMMEELEHRKGSILPRKTNPTSTKIWPWPKTCKNFWSGPKKNCSKKCTGCAALLASPLR